MLDSVPVRLRAEIDRLGLTLKEVSAKTGIPYRTLQDYMAGKREPGASNLARIATHLRVSIDWLLTGEALALSKKTLQVTEPNAIYGEESHMDDVSTKILLLLKNMSDEDRRAILKTVEEKKLLNELLEERKVKGAG